MDVSTALQELLNVSLIDNGLTCGIKRTTKALEIYQVHFCVLASKCAEPMYVKLVGALCATPDQPN